MKKLTESDIIRIFREEWQTKVDKLAEEIDVSLKAKVMKGKEKVVISPGLKIVHKKSKIRYTVQSVSAEGCILRTPEGKTFSVDPETLEREYELD